MESALLAFLIIVHIRNIYINNYIGSIGNDLLLLQLSRMLRFLTSLLFLAPHRNTLSINKSILNPSTSCRLIQSSEVKPSFIADSFVLHSAKMAGTHLQNFSTNYFQDIDRPGNALELLASSLDYLVQSSVGNATELLLNVIRLGDEHFNDTSEFSSYTAISESVAGGESSENQQSIESAYKAKGYQKVRGCSSNVWLGVTFDNEDKVVIDGYADSRISRGLLALLITV